MKARSIVFWMAMVAVAIATLFLAAELLLVAVLLICGLAMTLLFFWAIYEEWVNAQEKRLNKLAQENHDSLKDLAS